eukprot:m.41831 g.41831  ORF g.41831 m.41831 type:complete len:400 (-) comp18924_c0_seq2:141-1340(-)
MMSSRMIKFPTVFPTACSKASSRLGKRIRSHPPITNALSPLANTSTPWMTHKPGSLSSTQHRLSLSTLFSRCRLFHTSNNLAFKSSPLNASRRKMRERSAQKEEDRDMEYVVGVDSDIAEIAAKDPELARLLRSELELRKRTKYDTVEPRSGLTPDRQPQNSVVDDRNDDDVEHMFQDDADFDDRLHFGKRGKARHRAPKDSRIDDIIDDENVAAAFEEEDIDPDDTDDKSKPERDVDEAELQKRLQFKLGSLPTDNMQDPESGYTTIRQRRVGGAVERVLLESLYRGDFGIELLQLGLEIHEVDMGLSMRQTEIFWHAQGEPNDKLIEKTLKQHAAKIRHTVSQRLNLKFTPQFKFTKTTKRAHDSELDRLFAEVKDEQDAFDKRSQAVAVDATQSSQ